MLTNTILMNKIAGAGILDGEVPELGGVGYLKNEYKYNDGRIDFYVECDLGRCLIEVKNVTLFDDDCACFRMQLLSAG